MFERSHQLCCVNRRFFVPVSLCRWIAEGNVPYLILTLIQLTLNVRNETLRLPQQAKCGQLDNVGQVENNSDLQIQLKKINVDESSL